MHILASIALPSFVHGCPRCAGESGEELDPSLDERAFTFFNRILDTVVARANDEDDFDDERATPSSSLGAELLREFEAQVAAAVERFSGPPADTIEAQVAAALAEQEGEGKVAANAAEQQAGVQAGEQGEEKPAVASAAAYAAAHAGAAKEDKATATPTAEVNDEEPKLDDSGRGADEADFAAQALQAEGDGVAPGADTTSHRADVASAAARADDSGEHALPDAAETTAEAAAAAAAAAGDSPQRERGAGAADESDDEAMFDAAPSGEAPAEHPDAHDAPDADVAREVTPVNGIAETDAAVSPSHDAGAQQPADVKQEAEGEAARARDTGYPSTPKGRGHAPVIAGSRGSTAATAGLVGEQVHELLQPGDEVEGSRFRRAVFWHWANLEYGCSADLDWVRRALLDLHFSLLCLDWQATTYSVRCHGPDLVWAV
jgi:hypothetical protein